MLQPKSLRRLALCVAGSVFLLFLLAAGNGLATRWIDGDGFRQMLEKETSKGLHLQAGYLGVRRVGLLGLQADSFNGINGYKTIVTMQTDGITGWFNPLGIFLRRWQLDDLHGKSGTVMLQKTEATPGAKPPPGMPWWGLFWPYRVQLQDVKIDDANILWKLQEKESGIYHTFLEVTPNGHDFEYDALGGTFKTPMTPDLAVEHIHLLIRRPRLYCPELLLGDDAAHPANGLHVTGEAGLQDDRSMHLKMDVNSLNVSPWLPPKWRAHVLGFAQGHFNYESTGTGLETAQVTGSISVTNGVLHELAPVRKYVEITRCPDPGDLKLKTCEASVTSSQGAVSVENLKMESEGVFRLEGHATMAKDGSLSGTLEFGLTDAYLNWLPTAHTIFARDDGSYHFTTIHLSGTAKKPVEDLGPRIVKEVEKSPLLAIKLFFNSTAGWFDSD